MVPYSTCSQLEISKNKNKWDRKIYIASKDKNT